MKNALFILSFLVIYTPSVLTAQKLCQDYFCNYEKAKTALSNKQFKEALDYCKAAKAYPNAEAAEADALIYKVFEAIDLEKKAAQNNLKKANRLISYFGFNEKVARAWVYRNGKFGIIDKQGNLIKAKDTEGKAVGDFVFTNPSPFQNNGQALAQIDGYYHTVNEKGQLSLPYGFHFVCDNGWVKVNQAGKFFFIDSTGNAISPAKYTSIKPFNNGYAVVNQENKEGFINTKLDEILPTEYSAIKYIEYGLAKINKDMKWGILDIHEKVIIEPQYDVIEDFKNGFAKISKNDNWGLIDSTLKVVVEPQFKMIEPFTKGYFKCWQNGTDGWFLLDSNYTKFDSVHYNGIDTLNGDRYLVFNKLNNQRKKGLFDTQSHAFISPKFEVITGFKAGFAMFSEEEGGKFGFIDTNFKVKVDTIYQYVLDYFNGAYRINKNNKWGVIGRDMKEILKNEYVEITYDKGDKYSKIKKDSSYGLLDSNFTEVVKPQYQSIGVQTNGYFIIKQNNQYGLLNSDFTEIVKPQYDSIDVQNTDYFIVKKNSLYGLLDSSFKEVIKPQYEEISFDNDGEGGKKYIKIKKNGKFGLLDLACRELIKPQYQDVEVTHCGFFIIQQDSLVGLLDSTLKEIIAPQYAYIEVLNAHYILFSKDSFQDRGLEGSFLIDISSKQEYEYIAIGNDNKFPTFRKDDKIFLLLFLEHGLKTIAIPEYEDMLGGGYDLVKVKMNNQWGLMDSTGKEIVSPQFEAIDNLDKGYFKVKTNSKWGLIDSTGKEIVQPKFQEIDSLKDGCFKVKINSKWGLIDSTGKESVKPQFEDLGTIVNGFFKVKLNDKWGYMDTGGKLIIEPKFTEAGDFGKNNTAAVTFLGETFYINPKGEMLINQIGKKNK